MTNLRISQLIHAIRAVAGRSDSSGPSLGNYINELIHEARLQRDSEWLEMGDRVRREYWSGQFLLDEVEERMQYDVVA